MTNLDVDCSSLPRPPDHSTSPPPPSNVQNLGVASMIVGLVGVLVYSAPLFGPGPALAGPIAIFFGVRALWVARSEDQRTARNIYVTATIGIVSGVVATGFLLFWAAAFGYFILTGEDPFKGL